MKPRIVFFGNERLSTGYKTYAPTLRSLIKNNYEVVGIVANNSSSVSRKSHILEVGSIAKENNIPIFLPDKLVDIKKELENLHPTIGVLVAYGKIIPKNIFDLFPKGIVNIHPSLLPQYRGSTPIEQAILDGLSSTGVSLMQLVKEMDAGPIFSTKAVDIHPYESKTNLTNTLIGTGAELLLENLPGILDGSLLPTPQNEQAASYCKKINKKDGLIDWSKTAEQIDREVRAYESWPRSSTTLGSVRTIITQVSLSDIKGAPGEMHTSDKTLHVCTAKGSLSILKLIPEGKKEMPIEAFLAGYRSLLVSGA